jgi:hypothetical protein
MIRAVAGDPSTQGTTVISTLPLTSAKVDPPLNCSILLRSWDGRKCDLIAPLSGLLIVLDVDVLGMTNISDRAPNCPHLGVLFLDHQRTIRATKGGLIRAFTRSMEFHQRTSMPS